MYQLSLLTLVNLDPWVNGPVEPGSEIGSIYPAMLHGPEMQCSMIYVVSGFTLTAKK